LPKVVAVITTIQPSTPSVLKWVHKPEDQLAKLIVIGDRKGPDHYDLAEVDFYSMQDQKQLPYELCTRLPVDHYARKNIGYLIAYSQQPDVIYETDDDNAPTADWDVVALQREVANIDQPGWCNVYRYFSLERIWPRGFPLTLLADDQTWNPPPPGSPQTATCPIQQGLANGSPDVDAVWRIACDRPITFAKRSPVRLMPGVWCPFNSQNTWWFAQAWPLMYLPSHCTMRMTDIWRSFVAQRCLWAMDMGVLFQNADVMQQRNIHNLVSDLEGELPGYRQNAAIVKRLSSLTLAGGDHAVGDNLLACYQCLVDGGYFPPAELSLVKAWLSDLSAVRGG